VIDRGGGWDGCVDGVLNGTSGWAGACRAAGVWALIELGVVSPNNGWPNNIEAAGISDDFNDGDVRSFLACSAATAMALSTVGFAMA